MPAPSLFRLDPIVIKKPWGIPPERFERFTGVRAGFEGCAGELWTASALTDLPGRANPVAGLGGQTLDGLIAAMGADFLGPAVTAGIQNAPRGKTEAWTIRHVRGGVAIVGGLKPGVTPERFERLARDGFFERELSLDELTADLCEAHSPEIGATYLSRPGTLHTVIPLTDDAELVFDEVQQGFGHNPLPTLSKVLAVGRGRISLQVHPSDSDVANETDPALAKRYAEEPTLRVSDFGGPRPIQPEAALKAIRYGVETFSKIKPVEEILAEGVRRRIAVACRHFVRYILTVEPGCAATLHRTRRAYDIVHVAGGVGSIVADGQEERYDHGQTFAVPARCEQLAIRANAATQLIVDTLDDLGALQRELTCAGYAEAAIRGLAGGSPENEFGPCR